MNLVALLLFFSIPIQFAILLHVRHIHTQLRVGNQLLELTQHLKNASDNLQRAIDSHKPTPTQKDK